MVFTITFAIRASNNMLATTIPLISKYYFHFSAFYVGIISSITSIFSFISSIFINSRLSASSRNKSIRIASIFYAIIFPLFYFVNPLLVWVFTAVAGFSMGIIFPNIITFAGSIGDQRTRERMLALYTTSLSLSLIVSPGIESLILTRFSLIQAFVFFSVFSLIVPLISFRIKFKENNDSKNIKENSKNISSRILKSPAFLASLFNNMMYDIPFGMIETFGAIYAISLFHASYSLATLLFTLYFLTSFISRGLFTIRPSKNILNVILLNVGLTIIGLFVVSIAYNIYMYISALLVLGIPHGLTYPSSLILLSRNFRSDNERSIANSYFSGILIGLAGFIPIIMGYSVEEIGLRLSFGSLAIVSIILFLLMLKEYNQIKISASENNS
ncbi:MFS transporter [Acidianus sulfidivorans JP7]|uniref:MFS transporter n=1 Tax=Acidianus sulfidivorans JP7 TaxID=619593 RepID=A0A2U9IQK4_9CREN|nr:MFS transporter [Acidianus sulfidivorans JP7]